MAAPMMLKKKSGVVCEMKCYSPYISPYLHDKIRKMALVLLNKQKGRSYVFVIVSMLLRGKKEGWGVILFAGPLECVWGNGQYVRYLSQQYDITDLKGKCK